MKIKKIKFHKNKLLTLKLLKTQFYKNTISGKNINLKEIELNLKQLMQIIYKYSFYNKKILFIGIPFSVKKKFKKLLKHSNHIYLPDSVWLNSLLLNKKSCFKYLKNQKEKSEFNPNKKKKNLKTFELLYQLKKKIDLLIIFNPHLNNQPLNEGYLTRIPIITINNHLLNKVTYNLSGNFQFSKKNLGINLLISILINTFKKATLKKNNENKISI